ncbi:UNVERIFIED_CONTAM: hypothetical protein HDU68_012494 [Siphonaria sp. JEL0065]|nr:hypothetical protein HDU68_012494 [Siphonaria sp. JEL0065]
MSFVTKLFNRKKKEQTPSIADEAKSAVPKALPKIPVTATATTTTVTTVTKVTGSIHESRDPHVSAVARGLRVPLTIWLVGYSTLSMLPKAVKNESLLLRYTPGFFVVGLGRGELANEPLFLLSGLAAGLQLAAATPEGEHIPGTWALVKFWATKAVAVVGPIVSVLASVAVSAFTGGKGAVQHTNRIAVLFGALTDCSFYLAAPYAFKTLRQADRGAAPRLAVFSAILAGIISLISSARLGLHPATGVSLAGIPFAHTANASARANSAGLLAAVPLRFPAFFAGLALAVERERDTNVKGPSEYNQKVGLVISATLWALLLFTPPSYGDLELQQIISAFRYPAAALASYLALRPIVAVPLEVSQTSPWRRKLHEILTHPTFEAASSVILAAELVHGEVINGVFYLANRAGWVDAAKLNIITDAKVLTAWGVVVAVSLGAGFAIHKVLQAPGLKALKAWFEKKRDQVGK